MAEAGGGYTKLSVVRDDVGWLTKIVRPRKVAQQGE
jgi:hypothetical protein